MPSPVDGMALPGSAVRDCLGGGGGLGIRVAEPPTMHDQRANATLP